MLQLATLLWRGNLWREVIVRLHQKSTGPARRVKDGLSEVRIGDTHHEAHHRTWRVELARVARRIAHLAQHRLVQVRKRVNLVAGREVNAVDLVEDVS